MLTPAAVGGFVEAHAKTSMMRLLAAVSARGPTNDKSGDSFAPTKRNSRAPPKSKQTRCDTRPSQSRIDSEERRVRSGQRYEDWIERVCNRRHRTAHSV
jgi:hypothetical protein